MMIALLFFLGFMNESKAADLTIVDVRRNITLSEDDPVYKDFYISADSGSGLKKNLVVTAVRKINVRDASGANAVGEIFVPVGQLKIIAIYNKVAVAREFSLLSRDELPMLEQIGIMTGDQIDLGGAFVDNSKPKPRKKVSENPPAGTTTVVTTTTFIPLAATTAVPPATATAPAARAPIAASPVDSAKTAPEPKTESPVTAKAGEFLEKTADSGNNSPL